MNCKKCNKKTKFIRTYFSVADNIIDVYECPNCGNKDRYRDYYP
jgi:predicted RNA-binding Zn-ribbon protein involved in translation (DUF1610 family)